MSEMARLVGSLVIAGFDGKSLPTSFEQYLRSGLLGGVILFARNYQNRAQLRRLTSAIRQASANALIAVDQEGGRVVRFDGDFPAFPSPLYYAQRNDRAGLLTATAITARELKADGVNLNLVPVCDLAPITDDHVVHSRAFSSRPAEVAAVVAAQIDCLHRNRVLACAKHFPGLGNAVGDPHFVVSSTEQERDEFRSRDYEPFRAATNATVDLIMTTHLRAPALDNRQIATFSRRIVHDELRGEVGFDGVVISDDLQMLGALEGVDQTEAGVRAIVAGHNLILFAHLHDDLERVVAAMGERANSNEALALQIEESYHRFARFKTERSAYFSL